MFYTVYKITNLINGRFYIGKHQTKNLDDGYMGSGKLLRRAILKYGLENFKKDILEIYEQEWKMNLAERILVVVDKEVSYNLCAGGKGGRSVAEKRSYREPKFLAWLHSQEHRNLKKQEALRGCYKNSRFSALALQKLNSEETKIKRVLTFSKINHQQGSKNSQFGTCWITNGKENRKVKKEILENLEHGWYKGRT